MKGISIQNYFHHSSMNYRKNEFIKQVSGGTMFMLCLLCLNNVSTKSILCFNVKVRRFQLI